MNPFRAQAHHNYFIAVFAFAVVPFGFYYDMHWMMYSYLLHFFIFAGGICFYLHRGIVHRAYLIKEPFDKFFFFLSLLALHGSPVMWTMSHLHHHRYSDTEKDVHSPNISGLKVLFGYYNTANVEIDRKRIEELLKSPMARYAHSHYYLILIIYWSLLSLISFKVLFYMGLIPSAISYLTVVFINFFTHLTGYRNFNTNEKSRNTWWLWPLAFGENWHNNHHQYPAARTTKYRWWEFDLVTIFLIFSKKRNIE